MSQVDRAHESKGRFGKDRDLVGKFFGPRLNPMGSMVIALVRLSVR